MRGIAKIIAFGCAASLALASHLLVGCSNQEHYRFVGQWMGHQKRLDNPNANPDVVTTLSQVKLTIRPNNRFDLFYNAMPVSGNVAIDGKTATLTVTTTIDRALNMNAELLAKTYPPMTVRAKDDSTIQFSDPNLLGKETVALSRIATDPDARP